MLILIHGFASVSKMVIIMRPHPVYILYDAKKWIPLLVIWLLTQLLAPSGFSLFSAAAEIGWAALLTSVSLVRWFTARYRLDDRVACPSGCEKEETTEGLLLRRRTMVRPGDAASASVECTLLMWLTRSRRVRLHTAGTRRRAEKTFFLPAALVPRVIPAYGCSRVPVPCSYRSRIWPVLVMAASGSNIMFGLLTLSPAFYQAGDLAGSAVVREIPKLLTQQVTGRLAAVVRMGFPPFLNAAAGLLIWGWLLSFLFTARRYMRFTVHTDQARLTIRQGLIGELTTWIPHHKITAIELRQTLIMRLFSLRSVTVAAAGFGRQKGLRPVLIPAVRQRELSGVLRCLLPGYPLCGRLVPLLRTQLRRTVILPALLLPGGVSLLFFGGWYWLFGLAIIAGGGWWLAVRWLGFGDSGFGIDHHAVRLCYIRGLTFYEINIPLEVTDSIVLTQTGNQRRRGVCGVAIRCYGEQRRYYSINGLPYRKIFDILETYYGKHP